MCPLMSIWRNFFLGEEPRKWNFPLSPIEQAFAKRTAREQLGRVGLDVRAGRVGVDFHAEEPNAGVVGARTFQKSVGGSPTNVAVAASRRGRRAAVFTKVGDDGLGAYVRHALAEEFGVETRFVGTHPT